MTDKKRCPWVGSDPLDVQYHDEEWGIPIHDELLLFEFLILEGMQAGLSWITILKKRENYREAFDHFDPEIIAQYSDQKLQELLGNAGIVRNRLKIQSIVTNAKAFLKLKQEGINFSEYLWGFVEGTPIKNTIQAGSFPPSSTPLSDQLSKDLKRRGFKFIGSTICYAFMQAVGMVNDHTVDCFYQNQSSSSLLHVMPAKAGI